MIFRCLMGFSGFCAEFPKLVELIEMIEARAQTALGELGQQ